MVLSQKQINEIIELIDMHTFKFIGFNIGTQYLSSQEKAVLRKYGIKPDNITPSIENAFKFGMLSDMLGDPYSKNITYSQLKNKLKRQNFLPLTQSERESLVNIEYQSYSNIKGLGNRIKGNFERIHIEADQQARAEYESLIKKQAKEAFINRESKQQLKSRLGNKTGDWARDFDRISDFIMHQAHTTGRASMAERKYGTQAKVYIQVEPTACKHCLRLYTTNGFGSKPKTFTLSELKKNGTNVGRKVADWKPVLPPAHVYCRCNLYNLSPYEEWDEKTKQFRIKQSDRHEELKDSIKVTITED